MVELGEAQWMLPAPLGFKPRDSFGRDNGNGVQRRREEMC